MKGKGIIIACLMGLMLWAVACGGPGTEPVLAPEIVSLEASEITEHGVKLTATVINSAAVSKAGFKLRSVGQREKPSGNTGAEPADEIFFTKLDGASFTINLDVLEQDLIYQYAAFVENGAGLSITTGFKQFKTLKEIEPQDPGTDGPGSDGPAEPGSDDPGTDGPAEPGSDDPGTDDPGQDGPAEPGSDDPGTDGPGQDGPAEPGSDDPGTDGPGQDTSATDSITVSFADAALQAYMLWFYDADKDGRISGTEAARVTEINSKSDEIFSTAGIENLPNLETLHLAGTRTGNEGFGQISAVDLSCNPLLKTLYLCHNRIDSLDLSPCPNLEFFEVVLNNLADLDFSMLLKARRVSVANNSLTRIDARGLDSLVDLFFDCNPVTEVLLDNPALESIHANNTLITTIDLSGCPKLKSLDLSSCPNLKTVYLANGQVVPGLTMDKNTDIEIIYK